MKSVLMILPNHSWTPDSRTSAEERCEKSGGGTVSAEFVSLDKVNPTITFHSTAWKRKFRKKSVYPPIVIDLRWNGVLLEDGNHRVTVWREWGCTHAPAWVIRNE